MGEWRGRPTPALCQGDGHAIATSHCVPTLPLKMGAKTQGLPAATSAYLPLKAVTVAMVLGS